MGTITYIDDATIVNKRVLLRVDFDVPIVNGLIEDDTRITQTLPSMQLLLSSRNKLIILAKLGRPKERDTHFSLKPIVERVQKLLPAYQIKLVSDFLTETPATFHNQKDSEIIFLENLRFYPGEKENDQDFAKKLAALGDVYVNDGFAVSHRSEASIVGVPKLLPSFGGLLLKIEILALSKVVQNPEKPVVAILGGAKISTKLGLLKKLLDFTDALLVGGGIANTLLFAKGVDIGNSLCEKEIVDQAKDILRYAKTTNSELLLPVDVFPSYESIEDIGPQTQKLFAEKIATASTIIWNGPVGLAEKEEFAKGTRAIFDAIVQNNHAFSVVGGGDTVALIKQFPHSNKISHISTGGGAMLEFIEKGTLPGIEALKR